jgi:hypothetical protein
MSGSGSHNTGEEETGVSFRIDRERKQKVRIRMAQEGYDTLTEYFHDLIDEDLEDANVPLE